MRGPPIEEDPVQVLAAEFPGFPAEGLAEIYFSNGCDLALTMEMLTQLEVGCFSSCHFFILHFLRLCVFCLKTQEPALGALQRV